MKSTFPLARFEDIVVQELADEVLICDTKNDRVFCLNPTAGEVWKLCDGKTETEEIARILSRKLKNKISNELVLFSLNELAKHRLLNGEIQPDDKFTGLSRREIIRRIGLGSMVALPVISSVIMPYSAHAQSGGKCPNSNTNTTAPDGCPCNIGAQCISGCCLETSPGTGICGASFGVQGCICSSNAQCDTGFQCCAPGNPVCNPGC